MDVWSLMHRMIFISASEIASLPFRSGGLAAAGSRKGMESVLAL